MRDYTRKRDRRGGERPAFDGVRGRAMTTRKALIVGVDYYEHIGGLTGCVNDARSVRSVLERNADGSLNFAAPKIMLAGSSTQVVTKRQLRDSVRDVFEDDAEIALVYFAGHGYIDATGGFLCASDAETGDDGLSLQELMALANKSPAKHRIIILDSCHGGVVGNDPIAQDLAEISDGLTILTASTAKQSAMEVQGGGGGVFTRLLVDALEGAAANLVGDITPGSVYAHIDQSLGPWSQRPVFKTNVKRFVSLRRAEPPIALRDLRALTRYFPSTDHQYPLDPSYEPERSSEQRSDPKVPEPDPAHTAAFAVLQSYVSVNLVRPVGAPHMWHAAMNSTACELTVLGKHYWKLVHEDLI
jgi:Caspase domain